MQLVLFSFLTILPVREAKYTFFLILGKFLQGPQVSSKSIPLRLQPKKLEGNVGAITLISVKLLRFEVFKVRG